MGGAGALLTGLPAHAASAAITNAAAKAEMMNDVGRVDRMKFFMANWRLLGFAIFAIIEQPREERCDPGELARSAEKSVNGYRARTESGDIMRRARRIGTMETTRVGLRKHTAD